MESLVNNCLSLRSFAATAVQEAVMSPETRSEHDYATSILKKLNIGSRALPSGWYSPPPSGVSVLFGNNKDNYERTRFDTLRNEAFWPAESVQHRDEDVCIIYVSPVEAGSGIIGDWGATMYSGENANIQRHLQNCLSLVEKIAEFSEVGMKYGDISRYASKLLTESDLTTDRTLITNRPDATGVNCGHTIPWTNENPSTEEKKVLSGQDRDSINQLISSRRIFINDNEETEIPATGAFTAEMRLESSSDELMPNTFFHLIVAFENGKKTISGNYNELFASAGMDFLQSKY